MSHSFLQLALIVGIPALFFDDHVASAASPDLRITEVQSSTAPSPDLPTSDWWELTNFEGQPVDISGWRFNDNAGGWDTGFTFGPLVLAPGETIIFVEDLTLEQFRAWWGDLNLPAGCRIITYSGSGFSFGAAGDGVRLWKDAVSAPVASVDFGAALNGVSFNYDPETGVFGEPSALGKNGVIKAAAAPDIGSPGRIRAPEEITVPWLTSRLVGDRIRLEFAAGAGRTYSLQSNTALGSGVWINTGDTWQPTSSQVIAIEKQVQLGQSAFYRLEIR